MGGHITVSRCALAQKRFFVIANGVHDIVDSTYLWIPSRSFVQFPTGAQKWRQTADKHEVPLARRETL